jgi:predicted Fe-Mo cluster-binding NifX family protein
MPISEKNLQIAVCSQDTSTVTGHAGKCRKFFLFQIQDGKVMDKSLVEISEDETFHAGGHRLPVKLSGIKVLISGGMGQRLFHRLEEMAVEGYITQEKEPQQAVAKYLNGSLDNQGPHTHKH